jgi:hypothetical protein
MLAPTSDILLFHYNTRIYTLYITTTPIQYSQPKCRAQLLMSRRIIESLEKITLQEKLSTYCTSEYSFQKVNNF